MSTALEQYLSELEKLEKAATRLNAWYAHEGGDSYGPEATVRGPFMRWFRVTEVSPEYSKHVSDSFNDAKFATASMNALPKLLEITRIMSSALKYYAEDPSFKESSYIAIRSSFRSDNAAVVALSAVDRIVKEEK